jgi:hypothetical protein
MSKSSRLVRPIAIVLSAVGFSIVFIEAGIQQARPLFIVAAVMTVALGAILGWIVYSRGR